jgi:hypothetical protein
MRPPVTSSGCVKSQYAQASTAASGRQWRWLDNEKEATTRSADQWRVLVSGVPVTNVSSAPNSLSCFWVVRRLKVALAADTVSIAVMEILYNAVMLAVPGAMEVTVPPENSA